jgi:hypothetical protein
MTTQWHPIFAHLLRPLLEAHYEVRTGVPVGDAPRQADLVLLRRTSVGVPPFTGLWRWLTAWNVLEFKGPTVSARLDDLDALVELGLGIHRHLNEEAAKQGQPPVGRPDVSFWYLANHLGRRFLRSAADLVGPLESLGPGLWRVPCLQRPLLLVSGREVPLDRDSLPLHVLTLEPQEQKWAMTQVLKQNLDLWKAYSGWVAGALPDLAREIASMGRTRSKKFVFDFRPFIEEMGGMDKIVQDLGGLDKAIQEMGGWDKILGEIGVKQFLARLSPEQRQELARLLRKDSSKNQ